jgi:hypothetical protein
MISKTEAVSNQKKYALMSRILLILGVALFSVASVKVFPLLHFLSSKNYLERPSQNLNEPLMIESLPIDPGAIDVAMDEKVSRTERNERRMEKVNFALANLHYLLILFFFSSVMFFSSYLMSRKAKL